jgi:hypothetical protein
LVSTLEFTDPTIDPKAVFVESPLAISKKEIKEFIPINTPPSTVILPEGIANLLLPHQQDVVKYSKSQFPKATYTQIYCAASLYRQYINNKISILQLRDL